MASVVKDAADDPDCPVLREQWHYLRFYVHRTMPPTVGSDIGLSSNKQQAIISTNAGPVHWCIYVSLGLNELTHWSLVTHISVSVN